MVAHAGVAVAETEKTLSPPRRPLLRYLERGGTHVSIRGDGNGNPFCLLSWDLGLAGLGAAGTGEWGVATRKLKGSGSGSGSGAGGEGFGYCGRLSGSGYVGSSRAMWALEKARLNRPGPWMGTTLVDFKTGPF